MTCGELSGLHEMLSAQHNLAELMMLMTIKGQLNNIRKHPIHACTRTFNSRTCNMRCRSEFLRMYVCEGDAIADSDTLRNGKRAYGTKRLDTHVNICMMYVCPIVLHRIGHIPHGHMALLD